MTEPNDKLVEELARGIAVAKGIPLDCEYTIWKDWLIDGVIAIIARDTLAAYQRGLRDAAAICDEVAGLHACYAAQRIRERLP